MLTGRAVDFRVSSQATTPRREHRAAKFSTGRRGAFRSTAWGWKQVSCSFSENDRAARGIILLTGHGSGRRDALFGAQHINTTASTS